MDDRRTDATWGTRLAVLAAIMLLGAACGGGDDGADRGDGGIIGVVPGETTSAPDTTSGSSGDATTTTASANECPASQVCEIEVPLAQVVLDVTPSSISLDGTDAWLAAPDFESVVAVDLEQATVRETFAVGAPVVDVVAGAGSLWAVTYDFRFGPLLRIDPDDGSTTASIEEPSGAAESVVVGEGAVWSVIDGYGRVMRVDISTNQVTDVIGETEFGGSGLEVAIAAAGGFVWAIEEDTGSVVLIDAAARSIESTITDLGYASEPQGDFVSILADGALALAVVDEGVWVLADTLNPEGGTNVVGGGALFLLDTSDGSVIRRIDLISEPAFGRPGLAITDDAAWYFNLVDGYPIRVDLATERQTFVRLGNATAVGLVTDGTTVWVAAESFFENDWIFEIDVAAAAAATAELGG